MPSSVHVDANRGWGGGQAQSLGLALALSARGEDTWFFPQTGSALASRLPHTYLQWQAVPLRGLRGIANIRRLARRLRALDPGVVHIHDSASHMAAGVAARLAGTAKIVVTRRTELPLRGGRFGTTKYRLWCDKLICVSEAVRTRCLDAELSADSLVVIPDFVDCRHFHPESVPPNPSHQGPTIATVGALTRTKGHHILLQAMPRVARAIPRIRLLLCGEGEEREPLRRQAASLELADSLTFLGFVSDVRTVLAGADVFVMPSLSEGLGVAVLEAMAMARPLVASNAGGLPESIVDGETGLIVPAGDAAALAEALISLLGDPHRAREMGEAGRERAVAHFDRSRIVPRIVALYEALTGGGGG